MAADNHVPGLTRLRKWDEVKAGLLDLLVKCRGADDEGAATRRWVREARKLAVAAAEVITSATVAGMPIVASRVA